VRFGFFFWQKGNFTAPKIAFLPASFGWWLGTAAVRQFTVG